MFKQDLKNAFEIDVRVLSDTGSVHSEQNPQFPSIGCPTIIKCTFTVRFCPTVKGTCTCGCTPGITMGC